MALDLCFPGREVASGPKKVFVLNGSSAKMSAEMAQSLANVGHQVETRAGARLTNNLPQERGEGLAAALAKGRSGSSDFLTPDAIALIKVPGRR